MAVTPVLRQFMADRESLRRYACGELPLFDDITRRLFLLERAQDHRLPDHFYKRGLEHSLTGVKSLHELLTTGLFKLGSEHLILRGNRVHVKSECWSDWQELVTLCSPLVCICGLLWKDVFRPGTRDLGALADFTRECIEPNTLYTCLPSPRFPFMDKILNDNGLSDLHIHLTGTTETDVAWQVYLQHPFAVYTEITKAFFNEKVRDQFEQEFAGIGGALEFYRLLCTAIRLRYGFVHLLFSGRFTPELQEPFDALNTENILTSGSIAEFMIHPKCEHPLQRVFRTSPDMQESKWSDVSLEALLYVMVMDRIESSGDNNLAASFHHYLLILGLFNRFLVQQTQQCGFDQFQKITLNSFRDVPERQYERRFLQLHGNDAANLAVLEGRFAPKGTAAENIRFIRQIAGGWQKFTSKTYPIQPRQKPQLRLVCHFIKEADKISLTSNDNLPRFLIRHQAQRLTNFRKAQALMQAYEADDKVVQTYLCGIDAASNELEAPPEIFAPIYRYCRRKGIKHFTYHAGEDFHHLIGGLRAMYEVVEFLDLHRGDRIGHGTAAGIEPKLWLDHVGEQFAMSRGEWLDDLVFAIYFIEKNPASGLASKLHLLRSDADRLAHEVYGRNFTLYNHTRAWQARRCCPFHLLYDIDEAMAMPTWSVEEWRECEPFRYDREAIELLELYHRADCRRRYHEKIKIVVTRHFTADELRILQDVLLAELYRKEIVLEVLPTSNVRISFYKNYKEHHIWRWLGLEKGKEGKEGKAVAPPVVLGTDDTGIFSTNIYNEYCHIYHHLVHSHQQEYGRAADVIQRIVENGKVYGFKR